MLWFLLLGAVLVFIPAFILLRSRESSPSRAPVEPSIVTIQTLTEKGLPFYGDGELSVGVKEYAAGHLDKARTTLEVALTDPTQKDRLPEHLYYLGRTLIDKGERDAGEGRLIELIEHHKQSPYVGDAYGYYAALARDSGDTAKLEDWYRKIVKERPESLAAVDALRELAKVAEERKNNEDALICYSGLLRCDIPAAERKLALSRAQELAGQVIFTPRPTRNSEYYEVARGDTLGKIARRSKCSVGFLRLINNKSNDTIYIGERLKVLSGNFHIVVHKHLFSLTLFFNGMYLRHYDVGLGKHDKTPLGDFVINSRLKNPVWYWKGRRIPFGDPRNQLGTRWLGFAPKLGISGYGIHGTSDPESIGKNMSEGCIRMTNNNVEELFELVPRQTRVDIVQ